MNVDELKSLAKNDILDVSKKLGANDIRFLVEQLSEKDDKLRYNAFLLLQSSSRQFPLVYEYWGELEKKLESDNSYQRSLGIMLIAENVRWDKNDRFSKTIGAYLGCCNDEKFITARQTIQGLGSILQATKKYDSQIKQSLTGLSFAQYKENQQKLLAKDVSNTLRIIDKR
jgi:hypothetical protein